MSGAAEETAVRKPSVRPQYFIQIVLLLIFDTEQHVGKKRKREKSSYLYIKIDKHINMCWMWETDK